MGNRILYEAVEVSKELPEINMGVLSKTVYAINTVSNKEYQGMFVGDQFVDDHKGSVEVTHWLKPVDLSDVRNEVIKEVADKTWEAAIDFERDSFFGPVPTRSPNKTDFINSLIK